MGRYRPPRPAGSPYITPEGERTLRTELHELWKVERPEVTKAVSAAAANGDRSENGDYIYGKKRLREIDSRVRFLRKRLDALQVVEGPLGTAVRRGSAPGSRLRTRRVKSRCGGSWARMSLTSVREKYLVTHRWAAHYWEKPLPTRSSWKHRRDALF